MDTPEFGPERKPGPLEASAYVLVRRQFEAHVRTCQNRAGEMPKRPITMLEFQPLLRPCKFEDADSMRLSLIIPADVEGPMAIVSLHLSAAGLPYTLKNDRDNAELIARTIKTRHDIEGNTQDGWYWVLIPPEGPAYIHYGALADDIDTGDVWGDHTAHLIKLQSLGLTRTLEEPEVAAVLEAVQTGQPNVDFFISEYC